MNTTFNCKENELLTPACDPEAFYLALLTVIGLICVAGMMAGLTMGLLSLDQLNLQILQTSGTNTEKAQADKVLPIIKQHHLLLVTLLLFNAAANEALPVFLSRIVTEAQAVMISVTCVLFFGEIIPSAIFTGKQQLAIASALIPFVRLLMFVAYPLAWPIAKILDACLGEEHDFSRYKRKELKALVALHHKQSKKWINKDSARELSIRIPNTQTPLYEENSSYGAMLLAPPAPSRATITFIAEDSLAEVDAVETSSAIGSDAPGTPLYSMTGTHLHNDEVAIIHGAMDMSTKTVQMIMTPFDKVFMLDVEEKLNDAVMVRILASGYSRVPVFKNNRHNVVGLLLVKRLIVLNPAEEKPLKDLILRRPIVISPEHSCYSILNLFQEGRSHFALVTPQKEIVSASWKGGIDIDPNVVEILGIVTIEDVLEELIMEEIADESDSPHAAHPDTYLDSVRERGVLRATTRLRSLLEDIRQRIPSHIEVVVDKSTRED